MSNKKVSIGLFLFIIFIFVFMMMTFGRKTVTIKKEEDVDILTPAPKKEENVEFMNQNYENENNFEESIMDDFSFDEETFENDENENNFEESIMDDFSFDEENFENDENENMEFDFKYETFEYPSIVKDCMEQKNSNAVCPCCGHCYQDNEMYDMYTGSVKKKIQCKHCRSHMRHRNACLLMESDYFSKMRKFGNENFILGYWGAQKCVHEKILEKKRELEFDYKILDIERSYNKGFTGTIVLENESDFIISPLSKINVPNDYFDILIIQHVLEHVDDHIKGINEIKRIIKPGGMVFYSIPCYWEGHANDREGVDFYECKNIGSEFYPCNNNEHKFAYRCSYIKELFNSMGFECFQLWELADSEFADLLHSHENYNSMFSNFHESDNLCMKKI